MADRSYLERLSRELTDQGKLIEAGWVGLRLAAVDPRADKTQLTEMRKVFFAGAQHLFSSIMTILGEDREPTDEDLRRMSLIADELESFGHDLFREITGTERRQ
jgi:hypothetical protein